MSRPRKLTDKQVRTIQRDYQKAKGVRGTVTRMAQEYGVSRGTILSALDQSLPPTQSVRKSGKGPGHEGSNQPELSFPAPESTEGVSDTFTCDECYAPDLIPHQSGHTEWCSQAR